MKYKIYQIYEQYDIDKDGDISSLEKVGDGSIPGSSKNEFDSFEDAFETTEKLSKIFQTTKFTILPIVSFND